MKFIIILSMCCGLFGCGERNKDYYLMHPQELYKAVNKCRKLQENSKFCSELTIEYDNVKALANELHYDPQAFGKKIITEQGIIAKQQVNLDLAPNQEIKETIKQRKRNVAHLLAIVGWLETPE